MRIATGTVVELYKDTDPAYSFMKHPNHDRKFYSENLRCRECKIHCDICGKFCCQLGDTKAVLKFDPTSEDSKQLLEEILDVTPHGGVDESTIVACKLCEDKCCPNCFSICPKCFEPLCKQCHPRQFTICPRHVGHDQ